MSVLVIDDIGLLVTSDPSLGEGPLAGGRTRLVIDGEQVASIERAGAAGRRAPGCRRPLRDPGFVDSHTHLVFAGDRADEFAARMAGRPYAASGIRVTTEATRATSEDEPAAAPARARQAEATRAGITHLEIKSGYGLELEAERRSCEIAAELTDDVTFLGAHAVPEFEGDPDGYVELVCGEMLDACRPYARWIDVFCEEGAFDADQSRAVLEAGARRGSACACTATSWATGLGPARRGDGRGVGRPLHLSVRR